MNNQRICVICHLYYQDLWQEIKEYLLNLQDITGFDLFITCCEYNEHLFKNIKLSFNKNVNITIDIVDNKIRVADIYPFIHILNKINLDNYDLVYKIHTKQSFTNIKVKLPHFSKCRFYVGENFWRDFLINAILGKNNINKILDMFKKDKKLGCAGFYPLLITRPNDPSSHPDFKNCNPEVNFKKIKTFQYFAGTIFVVRAEILKCLQGTLQVSDFILPATDKFSPLAYIIEVYLGFIVNAQGYKFGSTYNFIHKFILTLLSHNDLLSLYKIYANKFILQNAKPRNAVTKRVSKGRGKSCISACFRDEKMLKKLLRY